MCECSLGVPHASKDGSLVWNMTFYVKGNADISVTMTIN